MAAAPPATASRNISRGCTMLASSVPTERTVLRSTRCFVSSSTTPNCSTRRLAYFGSRDLAAEGQGGHAADRSEHRVRQIQRARPRLPLTEHERDELVVAERGGADARELFTR